jgi:hypothetical protein
MSPVGTLRQLLRRGIMSAVGCKSELPARRQSDAIGPICDIEHELAWINAGH